MSPPDARVFLAAERTLLAWVRTGLALKGLGFLVARFDVISPGPGSAVVGLALVVASVAFTAAATWSYLNTVKRMARGEPYEAGASPIALALAGVLTIIGVGLAAFLLLVPS